MTGHSPVHQAIGAPAVSGESLQALLHEALGQIGPSERRFLALVPDDTRKFPVAVLFQFLDSALTGRADQLDAMIAQGTHSPMPTEAKRAWVFGDDDYPNSQVFDHAWDDPDALSKIGVLPLHDQLARFGSNAKHAPLLGFDRDMPIRVNSCLLDYDRLLLVTRVQPHEVAGFAGGAKQIFPGVSGPEMINLLHAIGSLQTNRAIHGVMPNPVRALIDDMAENVPVPITSICLVIDDHSDVIHGAFVQMNGWRESVTEAATLSREVNIEYVPQRVQRLIATMPKRADGEWLYPDLWTGAKLVLKTEDAVADGGELVVLAPDLSSISDTHGTLIREIGYHTYAYFLSQPSTWQAANATPIALNGSALVKGEGEMCDGKEVPRIDVRLATAIPPEECARLNLGYENPATVAKEVASALPNVVEHDRLVLPSAGSVLWRYKPGVLGAEN